MYEKSKMAMQKFYRKRDRIEGTKLVGEEETQRLEEMHEAVVEEVTRLRRENPGMSVVRLKSKVHTLVAKLCEPVIFEGNPFFFETAMNFSYSWGLGVTIPVNKLEAIMSREIGKNHPVYIEMREKYSRAFCNEGAKVCDIATSFDNDHHTLGYTKLFKVGINGIISEAKKRAEGLREGSRENDFCMAVVESCEAMVLIAHKFSEKAEELLKECADEKQRKYLCMIRDGAKNVPENPPKTFYEGLAMLIFTREVTAVMDNMGISQLGHVDRLLGSLYQKDIEAGRITEQEARELVGLWMMHTDIKFNLENNEWPETSTCLQLGGCDEKGNPVFNEVTKIFIEEHHRMKLVNPKLNCRYSKNSPEEYLKVIGKAVVAGHNNFALINDDLIIEALVKSGVEIEDARLYVNGGCQETMIEGCGHTEGAALYVSLLRVFDLFLHPDDGVDLIKSVESADTYEEFYKEFLKAAERFLTDMTDMRNVLQYFYKDAIAYPLYSASQKGCIERGIDHVRGGAKYNFSTIALVGFANVADSLYAIKELVYNGKKVELGELITAIENNWKDNEELRQCAVNLPKYGHNDRDADALANGLLEDLSGIVKKLKNERGGNYLPSTFVYRYNRTFAKGLRATPDGRCDNEYMAAGCSPSLIGRNADITETINSMKNIDFTACGGGISVVDVMLPVSSGLNEKIFASLMRACNECRCVTLQPNVVSVDELKDAKKNPEKHRNLIVRICGLSAYFTALTSEVQDEIINRNLYSL